MNHLHDKITRNCLSTTGFINTMETKHGSYFYELRRHNDHEVEYNVFLEIEGGDWVKTRVERIGSFIILEDNEVLNNKHIAAIFGA